VRPHFRVASLALTSLLTVVSMRASDAAVSPIPTATQQLLLVHAASWTAAWGVLERYERDGANAWKLVSSPIPVNIGRSGMAWGRGLHAMPSAGPRKTEGDGKSPAGVFPLAQAFGIAAQLPVEALGFPYLHTEPTTYCVEDLRSEHYNQIVDATEVHRSSWEKWSELKRPDGLFDWGLVVAQNQPDTVRGAGSCVFLHIWRGPHVPTAGCTAMPREQIEVVLRWLDPSKQPVLVQLPDVELELVRSAWALP
jgi:D-alanyl-D-alanine dipeptidase